MVQCDICDLKMKVRELERHMRLHVEGDIDKLDMEPRPKRHKNNAEEQTHVCTSCQMVFRKLSEYREHM